MCAKAEQIVDFDNKNENEITRAILKKWLSCHSNSYFKFILKLAKNKFNMNINMFSDEEKSMCLMLHYDIWQTAGNFESLEISIKSIGLNEVLVKEIIEVLEILIGEIDFIEKEIDLNYSQPLKIHSRYTREQILAAFGDSTFSKKSSNREGVVNLEKKNTELLLVTLEKTEKNYSPTTMYNDYAISESIFHWQSQNSSKPEVGKGLSYVNHQKNNKKILLFVREKNTDQFGNTMGYVFLGSVNYLEHHGTKPMNINWELKETLPSFIWKSTVKMSVG